MNDHKHSGRSKRHQSRTSVHSVNSNANHDNDEEQHVSSGENSPLHSPRTPYSPRSKSPDYTSDEQEVLSSTSHWSDFDEESEDYAENDKSQFWRQRYKELKARYLEIQKELDKLNRIMNKDKAGKSTPRSIHKRRKSRDKTHKTKRGSLPAMSPPSFILRRTHTEDFTKSRSQLRVESVNPSVFALHRSAEVSAFSSDESEEDSSHLRLNRTAPADAVKTSKSDFARNYSSIWDLDEINHKTGRTMLIEAIIQGDLEAVKKLIMEKANVNKPDAKNVYPLQWAIKLNHTDIALELISAGADINITDPQGNTPLHLCFLSPNNLKVLERLLNCEDIDLNAINHQGNTPLALATHDNAIEGMELLLKRGAEPNLKNDNGSTPLMIATKLGHVKAVKLLLDYKADPNLTDKDGNTALHLVVRFVSNKFSDDTAIELAELLLKHRINVAHQNVTGQKAIHLCNNVRLMRLLEDYDPGSKYWRCEIDPRLVKIYKDQVLGKGKFGTVYRGSLHGTPVAIKILHSTKINEKIKEDFLYEVGLMSGIRHPNVLIMMGTYMTKDSLALITEYMENGNLYQFNANNNLSWEVKLRCALTTCRGLAWLHALQPPILHRDLHSKNILVSANGDCKVSDFGLSQLQGTAQEKHTIYKRIIPPEVQADRSQYGKPSDAFQFGLVLYELLTKQKAELQFVTPESLQHLRHAYSQRPMQEYIDLIAKCTDEDPNKRPTFQSMLEVLERLYEAERTALFKTPTSPQTIEKSIGYVEDTKR